MKETEKKIRLAFEYGVVMAETARGQKVKLDTETIIRAEDMLIAECKKSTAERIALDMAVNILAALEVKEK